MTFLRKIRIYGIALLGAILMLMFWPNVAEASDGPIAIRYPNACEPSDALKGFHTISSHPTSCVSCNFSGDDMPEFVFITSGSLISKAVKAADILKNEGIRVGIILVETLKPYDKVAEILFEILSKMKGVVYAEEGIKCGGAAQNTLSALLDMGFDLHSVKYEIAAIDDNFASPTEKCDIYDYVGLSAEKLAGKMRNLM